MVVGALTVGGGIVLHAVQNLAQPSDAVGGWLALHSLVTAGAVVAGIVASLLGLAAARAQTAVRLRRAWLLLGVGVACWTLAELANGSLLLLHSPVRGAPSIADVGMVLGVALAFTGALSRPALGILRGRRELLLLDAALVTAALVALGWPFVVGPLFARSTLSAFTQATLLAPLVAGVGMASSLLLAREWRSGERRTAWILIGASVAWSAGALLGLAELTTGGPNLGIWRAAMIAVAFVALGCAAYADWLAPTEQAQPLDEPLASPVHFLVPFAALATVTLILALAPPVGVVPIDRVVLAFAWLLAIGWATLSYATLSRAHRYERDIRIGHAGTFRQEQQRRRQLEAIRDVAAELIHQLDLTSLLDVLARRAAELADASRGVVYLWDDAGQALVPRAWHGPGNPLASARLRLGEGAAGVAAAERRGVIVDDAPSSPDAPSLQDAPSSPDAPATSHPPLFPVLATPIVFQDRLVGVAAVMHERPDRSFGASDLDLLGLFAEQAAIAIEHAQIFENVAMAEALRELARLKSEFLSTASHELRTPLTLIHGYAELLRMRAARLSAGEVADMAGEILGGSTTMIRLVDDLLDFARLESSRPVVQPRSVDVELLLRRQLGTFQEPPGGDRIVLEAESSLVAEVDPSFLQQIVRNLVANAVAYAPRGPIAIRATRRDTWLVLEVADDGPGLPAGEQARVWETFYRGEQARVSQHRGSGLGLAVVKQLVDLHGGRAEVESPSGDGATFRITLPAGSPDAERETLVTRPS